MAGLMNPQDNKSELLTAFRAAFGPRSGEKQNLQSRIEALTQSQLQTVMTYAQLVKMAQNSFGNSKSYQQLVNEMYPNMQSTLRSIIGDMLQDADPIELPDTPVEPEPTPRELSKEFYDNLTPLPPLKPAKRYPETDAEISDLLTNLMRDAYGDERTDRAIKAKPKANAPFKDKAAFLAAMTPVAKEVASDLGISHKVILAQAALESGWGSKFKGNNLMGIKSHGEKGGVDVVTHEIVNGKKVKITDSFKQYDTPEDSIRGYGSFLKANPRYKYFLAAGADNEDAQLTALQQSGYATDTKYAQKLKSVIKGLPSGDDA